MSKKHGAHQWRGVINEYRDWLPVSATTPVITLREGGTPLIEASYLSKELDNKIWLKVEGTNPTGSFKDRGMTMAISKAAESGAKAVICASTGNTSASAAAYAAKAGMVCAVLVPEGKIAMGKMAQAVVHGARILQIDGNFDDCLNLARELASNYPVALVNSVNPHRIEGQKTAAFEVVDFLGNAPDMHVLPVGNAGNITAYWKGYVEYASAGIATSQPAMWGFQAEGAAPIVRGAIVENPETIATAIRIGNPASWQQALAAKEGVFVEPASAAGVAGLIQAKERGSLPKGQTIVITVTGNGLKDVHWALEGQSESAPKVIPVDLLAAASALELA
jgi:threonine synthase